MSASTFYSLVDAPAAVGASGTGSDSTLIARTLEARKQGGGPTAALGLGGGAAVYADQFKITASDGLHISPLFVLPGVAAEAAVTLDVTKSGATYFIQGGTYAHAVTLRLPALSAARAGFKARFRIVSGALTGNTVTIQQNDTSVGAQQQLAGFIASRAAIPAVIPDPDTGALVGTSIAGKALVFEKATDLGSKATVGDWLEVESDGATWHVTGSQAAAGNIA